MFCRNKKLTVLLINFVLMASSAMAVKTDTDRASSGQTVSNAIKSHLSRILQQCKNGLGASILTVRHFKSLPTPQQSATQPFQCKHDPAKEVLAGLESHMPVIFAHGLGGNRKQAQYYKYSWDRPSAPFLGSITAFNFYEVAHPGKAYLGQGDDYQTLHKFVKESDDKVIIFGVSRGAATGLIELGVHHNDCDKVAAAILESPFDTVKSIVNNKLGIFRWIPGLSWLGHKIAVSNFVGSNYNPNGVCPMGVIEQIPKDKPLFLFCSKEDTLIPYTSTVNIYKKLRATGHNKVYLMITEKGEHANIMSGPEGKKVRDTIHAFLQENHLPCDEAWAKAGKDNLLSCQPL